MIFETERLYIRELNNNDYDQLCEILQDSQVMYAYEHPFSDAEVKEWLDRQISRYKKYGFGLWAVILKENGKLIGQAGLTMQPINDTDEVMEIGYLFNKEYWHKGYAVEAAVGCKKYAFEVLNADRVYSIIRESNIPSQNVAIKNDMIKVSEYVKHYYGMDMLHYVYCAERY